MHDVRVAEEVVQVAEDLLVRTDEERADQVRVGLEVGSRRVQGQDALAVDEVVDLAVGVARHVGDDPVARRPLVEAVDRADREELVDRPRVGHRLEDAQVAEVRIRQQRLQVPQLLGHLRQVQPPQPVADQPRRGEEQRLAVGPLPQRAVAEAEQVLDLPAGLLDVVEGLDEVRRRHVGVGVEQVHQRQRQRLPLRLGR